MKVVDMNATTEERMERYPEIIELYNYCVDIGVKASLRHLYDGFKIIFNNGADFIQHHGSYGCDDGCVEPQIGCKSDYTAVSLNIAKGLVQLYKRKLNKKEENTMTYNQKAAIRSLTGKQNRTKGKVFEEYIETACAVYKDKHIAYIEKTPEPMKIIRSIGEGKFIAVFEKSAQPDFKGTLKGG